jgi:hypothetical protein
VWWVDLSPLDRPGRYQLYSPALGAPSYEFEIAPDVYAAVMRTALKTFYRQRCGTPKPARYAGRWADGAACHRADAATTAASGQPDFGTRDLSGGWHDAGDYNKYAWKAASDAIVSLLAAWEDDPAAFRDGDLDIPESGNGVPDILDEVRWELDFLLKMQLPDGSVLSRVHSAGNDNGAAPPSADLTRRYYEAPGLESGAVLAGSGARAARIFRAAGLPGQAAPLERAARAAWGWLQGHGDGAEKVWAAAEVFRMDPSTDSARRYVDAQLPARVQAAGGLGVTSHEAQAAFTYVQTARATPAVASALRAAIGREVDRIIAADDLYRSGMAVSSYHWGSNQVRAGQGVFLLRAARLGATGTHGGAECRRRALDFLHFFHGQNPLSMVYLTNMAGLGGEHSSWQVFHHWFGQSLSAHSRSRYLGKPPSVFEPHYPYFTGTDNHGRRDDKASTFGPAPGFVPGGPNKDYSGDAVPPGDARHPGRSYRDWSDQSAWTARTWEITENSIGYQGPYVALASAFVAGGSECSGGDRCD